MQRKATKTSIKVTKTLKKKSFNFTFWPGKTKNCTVNGRTNTRVKTVSSMADTKQSNPLKDSVIWQIPSRACWVAVIVPVSVKCVIHCPNFRLFQLTLKTYCIREGQQSCTSILSNGSNWQASEMRSDRKQPNIRQLGLPPTRDSWADDSIWSVHV